jgi:hypothetical protein
MKIKIISVLLLAMIQLEVSAQDGTKKPAQDPALLEIPAIKELTAKIDAAKVTLASSSRAAVVELQAKVDALYVEYKAELEKQVRLQADNNKLVTAIKEELSKLK